MKTEMLEMAKPLATLGLPVHRAASTSGQTRGAWMREMENAQMDAWLTHPVPVNGSMANAPAAGQKDLLPRGCASKTVFQAQVAKTQTALEYPAPPSSKSFVDLKAPSQHQTIPSRAMDVLTTWASPAVATDVRSWLSAYGLGEAFASPRKDVSSPAPDIATRNPIRVHVQETPDGLSIWMGLDAQEQTHIPAILADLMARLEVRGMRLTCLICNGRVVYVAPSNPGQETQHFPIQNNHHQES